MELPASLVTAIESAHIAFEGLSHPLKVVSVDPDPAPPEVRSGLAVTAEITHNGEHKRVVCRFSDDELAAEPQVVDRIATAMRATLLDGMHVHGARAE
jgi:hypothetical protein